MYDFKIILLSTTSVFVHILNQKEQLLKLTYVFVCTLPRQVGTLLTSELINYFSPVPFVQVLKIPYVFYYFQNIQLKVEVESLKNELSEKKKFLDTVP